MLKYNFVFPYDLIGRKVMYLSEEIKNSGIKFLLFEKDNRRVNTKSVLGLLSLGIKREDKIIVHYDNETELKKFLTIIEILKEY
jgi:phosphotransferase system HPr-like phosphotransfer protein